MKKITMLLSTLGLSIGLAQAATTTTPPQEQALADWVKANQSTSAIVMHANEFNKTKSVNTYEGIGCVRELANGNYETTANPDPEKMKNTAMTPEMKNILVEITNKVKGKSKDQPESMRYNFEGKEKEGVIYRLDDHNVCMAFWVVSK